MGTTDGHELIKELGSSCACADSLPRARLYPETEEAVERWHQGKINIFDEMARLETERNRHKRSLQLVAEDCEAWLRSECDETCCEMIKMVAKFAREALQ